MRARGRAIKTERKKHTSAKIMSCGGKKKKKSKNTQFLGKEKKHIP